MCFVIVNLDVISFWNSLFFNKLKFLVFSDEWVKVGNGKVCFGVRVVFLYRGILVFMVLECRNKIKLKYYFNLEYCILSISFNLNLVVSNYCIFML